jgi:NifB/MoaA-like Fe-S oxidoreductase
MKKCNNLHIDVYEITNRFFGESITVTGLLTGRDLAEQLEGKPLGEKLFISSSMLKSDEAVFLDNLTFEQLANRLGVVVCAVEPGGYALFEALTEKNKEV